jgi:hypothetical protein
VGVRLELIFLACAATLTACASSHAPRPTAAAAPIVLRAAPEPLRLPVDGVWVVIQGYHGAGSHHGYAAFALDLVKLEADGQAYRRSGRRLRDWHGFGADVLASADGVVVRARDHFADNRVMGRGKDTNTVIVQHGGVYSEYVHLQRGSLRVREGDHVTRGQVLARVGNSGCETPHLHWALLSSLEPIRTMPAVLAFEALDASGMFRAASGAPSEGATIRPRSRRHAPD